MTAQRLRAATDVLIRSGEVGVERGRGAWTTTTTRSTSYGKPNLMSFVTEAGQLSAAARAGVKYTITSDPPQIVLQESSCFDAEEPRGRRRASDATRSRPSSSTGSCRLQFEFYDRRTTRWECGKDGWCKSWNYVEMEMLPLAVRLSVRRACRASSEDDLGPGDPAHAVARPTRDELPEPPRPSCEGCETLGTSTERQQHGQAAEQASSERRRRPRRCVTTTTTGTTSERAATHRRGERGVVPRCSSSGSS